MSTPEQSERKIPFSCPHCGHHTEVDAKFAGRSGPCVGCSNVITVPTLESLVAPNRSSVSPRRPQEAKPTWIKVGMAIGAMLSLAVIGVVVWAILQPAFAAARSAAKCSECESNLRVIGQAIESYYADKGHYPPAFVTDENGKPMHSWRVLILPYLGPQANLVYDQYKMDQPWDGPDNIKLENMIPQVYRCPTDPTTFRNQTSYLAIVGDDTLINQNKPASRSASYDGPVLRDNPSETMVVLECSDSQVSWLKPQDIAKAALTAGLNSKNLASPGSHHLQGVNILMADESIIRLDPDLVDSEDLRGMATIDGGDEYIEILEELDY